MPEARPAAVSATPNGADPYRNYNFKLDVGGNTQGHFTECSNIGARIQAIPYREGGAPHMIRRVPGRVEYSDVVLRYGLTSSRELWDWFWAAAQGNVQRKNVSIILLDSTGMNEVMRWNLDGAWPREWNGAALDARGQDVAIESITLVFEHLNRG